MFKKEIFLYVMMAGLFLPILSVQSAVLQTRDQSCRFNYLTSKNTNGWYILVSKEMCQNGLVQGQGEVTIYNAFSKPAEQIYGFFNAGYWTGDMALSVSILGQTAEPDGTQKVFFNVPNETFVKADFIGQMTANRQKDGSYTPFSFCNPFRILVKTDDLTTFQNQDYTTNLMDGIVKQVKKICPTEQKVMLYASKTDYPTPNDIFFYAIVDLQTYHVDVKKNTAFMLSQENRAETDSSLSEKNVSMPPSSLMSNASNSIDIADIIADSGDALPIEPAKDSLSLLLPQEIPALLDKVPHLLMASRVLQKPVLGAAIVHIKSVQDTSGVADSPSSLHLNGAGLSEGWGVVSGTFTSDTLSMKGIEQGKVQVSSFVPCLQERCQELEGKNE